FRQLLRRQTIALPHECLAVVLEPGAQHGALAEPGERRIDSCCHRADATRSTTGRQRSSPSTVAPTTLAASSQRRSVSASARCGFASSAARSSADNSPPWRPRLIVLPSLSAPRYEGSTVTRYRLAG